MKDKDSKYNKQLTNMSDQTSNGASENLTNSESTSTPQNNYPSDIQRLFERLGLL